MNIDIHAITVCVNYSHLLKYTIISNKHFFKRWVIVTHETDLDTIKLCKKHNLEYIFSKSLYNRTFFKSGAINEAIDYLGDVDWILHIDADIVLPQNFPYIFREDIHGKPLIRGTYLNWPEGKGKLYTTHKFRRYVKNSIQEPVLYCMGRVNVDEGEDLETLNIQKYFDQEDKIVQAHKGYGYFQLWNNSFLNLFYANNLVEIYPTHSRNAGADDWIFAKMFTKIVSLDTYCVHLSPEEINWNGVQKVTTGMTMKEHKRTIK
tara:strand:- start:193 stop:978 length:786 start_codon:yes stop_codon:yes gene_type:complete